MVGHSSTTDKPTPADTGPFKFVNLSHPEAIRKNRGVRTEIRRHVMKDIGQQRRRAQPKPKESSIEASVSTQTRQADVISPSRSLVSVSGLPTDATSRVRELLHFAKASSHIYQPLRSTWIKIALTDPGAFNVTLGNTATFLANLKGGNHPLKNPEIVGHYSSSVVLLRQRLTSTTEVVREGTIANILAHVCLCIRYSDWDSWRAHMDGLGVVSKLRGGLADLAYRMPLLILLYDISGSMVYDSPPRFPLPLDILPVDQPSLRDVPRRLQALLFQIQQMPPHISVVSVALEMVSSIADVINLKSHSAAFWERDIDAVILLGPCIHFLLSMPRLPEDFFALPDASDLVMREMLRLVCLLIMTRLKSLFSLPASEQGALEAKLNGLVSQYAWTLEKRHFDLKSWAITTAALLGRRGERGIYIQELQNDITTVHNRTPEEAIDLAQRMIWINFLETPNVEDLLHEMNLDAVGEEEEYQILA